MGEAVIQPLSPGVRSYLRTGVALCSVTQCVEELVLNSLDACATCVAVRVDLSCFKIQVVDNGTGMSPVQLELVGQRYHTSKCHTMEDLLQLCHYGYRGEAIASLKDASSVVEISSRTKQSSQTFCKIFNKGTALNVVDSSVPRPSAGTTITVHDLFYNLPVRKKAMNEALEFEKVRKRIEGIALMRPAISFTLRNDVTGNVVLQTHKTNSVLNTFTSLYGLGRAKTLSTIHGCAGCFRLEGYIGKEGFSKKDLQFVYINKRLVLKTRIHKVVNGLLGKSMILRKKGIFDRQGESKRQESVLSLTSSPTKQSEKFGVFVLNISCPYTEYDVTFEPAKTLVEFKNWDGLCACVEGAVLEFLKTECLMIGIQDMVSDDKGTPGVGDKRSPDTDESLPGSDLTATSKSSGESTVEHISTHNNRNFLTSKSVKRPIRFVSDLTKICEGENESEVEEILITKKNPEEAIGNSGVPESSEEISKPDEMNENVDENIKYGMNRHVKCSEMDKTESEGTVKKHSSVVNTGETDSSADSTTQSRMTGQTLSDSSVASTTQSRMTGQTLSDSSVAATKSPIVSDSSADSTTKRLHVPFTRYRKTRPCEGRSSDSDEREEEVKDMEEEVEYESEDPVPKFDLNTSGKRQKQTTNLVEKQRTFIRLETPHLGCNKGSTLSLIRRGRRSSEEKVESSKNRLDRFKKSLDGEPKVTSNVNPHRFGERQENSQCTALEVEMCNTGINKGESYMSGKCVENNTAVNNACSTTSKGKVNPFQSKSSSGEEDRMESSSSSFLNLNKESKLMAVRKCAQERDQISTNRVLQKSFSDANEGFPEKKVSSLTKCLPQKMTTEMTAGLAQKRMSDMTGESSVAAKLARLVRSQQQETGSEVTSKGDCGISVFSLNERSIEERGVESCVSSNSSTFGQKIDINTDLLTKPQTRFTDLRNDPSIHRSGLSDTYICKQESSRQAVTVPKSFLTTSSFVQTSDDVFQISHNQPSRQSSSNLSLFTSATRERDFFCHSTQEGPETVRNQGFMPFHQQIDNKHSTEKPLEKSDGALCNITDHTTAIDVAMDREVSFLVNDRGTQYQSTSSESDMENVPVVFEGTPCTLPDQGSVSKDMDVMAVGSNTDLLCYEEFDNSLTPLNELTYHNPSKLQNDWIIDQDDASEPRYEEQTYKFNTFLNLEDAESFSEGFVPDLSSPDTPQSQGFVPVSDISSMLDKQELQDMVQESQGFVPVPAFTSNRVISPAVSEGFSPVMVDDDVRLTTDSHADYKAQCDTSQVNVPWLSTHPGIGLPEKQGDGLHGSPTGFLTSHGSRLPINPTNQGNVLPTDCRSVLPTNEGNVLPTNEGIGTLSAYLDSYSSSIADLYEEDAGYVKRRNMCKNSKCDESEVKLAIRDCAANIQQTTCVKDSMTSDDGLSVAVSPVMSGCESESVISSDETFTTPLTNEIFKTQARFRKTSDLESDTSTDQDLKRQDSSLSQEGKQDSFTNPARNTETVHSCTLIENGSNQLICEEKTSEERTGSVNMDGLCDTHNKPVLELGDQRCMQCESVASQNGMENRTTVSVISGADVHKPAESTVHIDGTTCCPTDTDSTNVYGRETVIREPCPNWNEQLWNRDTTPSVYIMATEVTEKSLQTEVTESHRGKVIPQVQNEDHLPSVNITETEVTEDRPGKVVQNRDKSPSVDKDTVAEVTGDSPRKDVSELDVKDANKNIADSYKFSVKSSTSLGLSSKQQKVLSQFNRKGKLPMKLLDNNKVESPDQHAHSNTSADTPNHQWSDVDDEDLVAVMDTDQTDQPIAPDDGGAVQGDGGSADYSDEGQPWMEAEDPKTGEKLYVNRLTGHTRPQDGSWVPPQEEVTKNNDLRTPSVRNSTLCDLSPQSHNTLLQMMSDHLVTMETEEEDLASVKWMDRRSDPEEVKDIHNQTEDVSTRSVEDLLKTWANPVFDRPEQEVVTTVEASTKSRGSAKAHRMLHPRKFTKAMLSAVKVVGQVDNKFIACMTSDQSDNLSAEPNLMLLFDQHAAHERVRLERLTKEACEGDNRIRRSEVTPAEPLCLTEEEVRIMAAYKEEFSRIGVDFSLDKQRDTILVHTIPACIMEKEVNEVRRKRDSIAWNVILNLVKEHVEMLMTTSGAQGRLPATLHKVLCSQACHGAIKFGTPLSVEECVELLESLAVCDLPFQCAHGRPSVMPLLEMDRLQSVNTTTRPNLWKISKQIQK